MQVHQKPKIELVLAGPARYRWLRRRRGISPTPGSGADRSGEAVGFGIAAVDYDNSADGLDQNRVVVDANRSGQFAPGGFVERGDAQLDQFVVVERGFNFAVQVFGHSFLADDDYGF